MRVVAEDLWFPEGPVWVGDGSLLVVEIRRKTLTRIWPDGRKQVVAELGGGPNGAAMGPDGHCYVANNGGFKFTQRADGRWVTAGTPDDYVTGRIERVNLDTGKFETVVDRIGDMKIRGPNDLVLDAHGGIWFTDPGKTRSRDWDRGSVCYVRTDGSMAKEPTQPPVTGFVRIGGGSRLKIVESLAMGTPVVSTTIGAQGLGLSNDQDILLADDASAFAAQTSRLLLDQALRDRLSAAGLNTVRTRLSWPMLGRQLEALYTRLFGPR